MSFAICAKVITLHLEGSISVDIGCDAIAAQNVYVGAMTENSTGSH